MINNMFLLHALLHMTRLVGWPMRVVISPLFPLSVVNAA